MYDVSVTFDGRLWCCCCCCCCCCGALEKRDVVVLLPPDVVDEKIGPSQFSINANAAVPSRLPLRLVVVVPFRCNCRDGRDGDDVDVDDDFFSLLLDDPFLDPRRVLVEVDKNRRLPAVVEETEDDIDG
jgi:hypothetical protein